MTSAHRARIRSTVTAASTHGARWACKTRCHSSRKGPSRDGPFLFQLIAGQRHARYRPRMQALLETTAEIAVKPRDPRLLDIYEKVIAHERLTPADALSLFES